MTPHLSALALDEAATGLTLSEKNSAHLQECRTCQEVVATRKTEAAELARNPRAMAVKNRLLEKAATGPKASWWAPLGLLAVASMGWLFLAPLNEETLNSRMKGSSVSLEFLRLSDGLPVTTVKSGELLKISVATPRAGHVCVVMVDAEGSVSWLWPAGAGGTSSFLPGGETTLNSGFRVTPGSLTLHVLLGETPWTKSEVLQKLGDAVKEAQGRGQSPLEVRLEDAPGYFAQTVTVEP